MRISKQLRDLALNEIRDNLRFCACQKMWDRRDLETFRDILLDLDDAERELERLSPTEDALRYQAIRRELSAGSTMEFVASPDGYLSTGEIDALVDRHLRGMTPKPKRSVHLRVVKE